MSATTEVTRQADGTDRGRQGRTPPHVTKTRGRPERAARPEIGEYVADWALGVPGEPPVREIDLR